MCIVWGHGIIQFFLQEYNICFKMAKNSGSGWLLVFKGAGAQSVKNAVCYVCMHVSAQVGMFYQPFPTFVYVQNSQSIATHVRIYIRT